MGKFHGVTHRHVKLVRKLGGDGVSEEAPPLPSRIVRRVDSFLDVPPRLGKHLPHFARHLPREILLAGHHEIPDSAHDVAPLRCRREAPSVKCGACGADRLPDILLPRFREYADHFVPSRGIPVLERLSGRGINPLPVDEILEFLRHGCSSA
jgi:hypothetical protein